MPHAVGTVSARIWPRRGTAGAKARHCRKARRQAINEGVPPGRESVELCGQDAEAAGALSVVLKWQECAPTTRERDVGVFFCRHGRSIPQ